MDGRKSSRRRTLGLLLVLVAAVVVARSGLKAASASPHGVRLAMLSGLRLGYPIVLTGLGLGLVAMVVWLALGPRSRASVKILALGLSLGLSVLLAEGAAGAYLAWVHRMPALPNPIQRPANETGDVRIVVVGESSAEGVPYRDWMSVGKVVAWQLRKAIPWRMFHVEVQARPGWTLEQMHQRLVESRTRPDVVILYAGHNEFASRFGWSSGVPYYEDEPEAPLERMAFLAARFSPLQRLVGELLERERVSAPPEPRPRRLVDVPSQTTAQRAERLADFRRRLEGMVAYCERVGALPVLVIPPGNDAGYEPNRSILPPDTPRAVRDEVARRVDEARALETTEPRKSEATYEAILGQFSGFAEAHFRLARLLEARGDAESAYGHYVAARDGDGQPMRCPSDFQDVFREVAGQHDVVLVDGQAAFHAKGQLDDVLFNDAMHPSFAGQVALSEAILQNLKARGAFGWPQGQPARPIDLAECAEHFDVRVATWRAVAEFAASFYRTTSRIRFDSAERRAKAERYGEVAERLARARSAEGLGVAGVGALRR